MTKFKVKITQRAPLYPLIVLALLDGLLALTFYLSLPYLLCGLAFIITAVVTNFELILDKLKPKQ
jgi:hypothetical protein